MSTHIYTEEKIVESAKPFRFKTAWKKACRPLYNAALRRREVFEAATAHMAPMSNPRATAYSIYAYIFADGHVYVGLSYQEKKRSAQHRYVGPVHEHRKVCPEFQKRLLQTGIKDPKEAVEAERRWITYYREQRGQVLLNRDPGGSLGTVHVRWTPELLQLEFLKYRTKTEVFSASPGIYALAKELGCFESCAAHMPKYDKSNRLWTSPSVAARAKMSAAKVGIRLADDHKAHIGTAIKDYWTKHRDEVIAKRDGKLTGRPRGWTLTNDEAAYLGVPAGRVDLTDDQKKVLSKLRYASSRHDSATR